MTRPAPDPGAVARTMNERVRDSRFARLCWLVLALNVAVILWGAYVRATGSGAGCGSHWPLCNGEVIPRSPSVETLVEYSHRLTSGLALLAVLGLTVGAFRRFGKGHPARLGAALSLFFMLTEAAVGAGLVLFELVADNESMARALFMGTHLVNTFLLLAALTLTAYWAGGGGRVSVAWGQGGTWKVLAGVGGTLLVGISGAVCALGDTLYPAATLAEALEQDLSATAHILIRLRLFHPLIAVVVSLYLIFLGRSLTSAGSARPVNFLSLLVFAQLAVGTLNVALLAPVWMQLVHLLLADGLWVLLVLVAAEELRAEVPEVRAGSGTLAQSRA